MEEIERLRQELLATRLMVETLWMAMVLDQKMAKKRARAFIDLALLSAELEQSERGSPTRVAREVLEAMDVKLQNVPAIPHQPPTDDAL